MAFKTFMFKLFLFMCVASFSKVTAAQRPLGKAFDRVDDISQDVMSEPRKRPFCNAFTGCGRKRSSPDLIQENKMYHKVPMEDMMEAVVDMSSEPAVDEISKQILSEAKMWEALQEAGAEMMRRRQFQKNMYPGNSQ